MLYKRDTNCGWKHPFNKGKRNHCKAVVACIQSSCAGLLAKPTLYVGCESQCNVNAAITKEAFLCDIVGGEELFDLGIVDCGFDPQKKAEGLSSNRKYIEWGAIGFLGILVLGGIYKLFTNK